MLTEQQRMIRDTAQAFAEKEIKPYAAEWDRQAATPRALYDKLGAAGLLGVCLPPEFGGAGADFVSYLLAMEELAAADCGIANMVTGNNMGVGGTILREGTAEQKAQYLPKLASGEMIGAILLTEPQAGSDAANLKTRARRVGDKYVIDGTKQFVTGGRTAEVAIVVAVTVPGAAKRGITCFLVPTDRPGYRVIREEAKLGHRTNDTCQIALEGLEAGADEVLGEPGRGLGIILGNLSVGRIGVAAQAVGCARAAHEAALDFARTRETFGKPILEHQAIAFMLADMATGIEAGRQMYLHAAAVEMSGAPSLKEAAMAKLFASEMAERVCSDAIQIHGGYGFINDYPVEKIYRDVRVLKIYEGTSEVQKIVISRQLAAGG